MKTTMLILPIAPAATPGACAPRSERGRTWAVAPFSGVDARAPFQAGPFAPQGAPGQGTRVPFAGLVREDATGLAVTTPPVTTVLYTLLDTRHDATGLLPARGAPV
ncbi:MAG TPA: hypothetical protein VFR07_02580 [Mycobacteriales bacterium]|nr:hypothetical protein [Mycobacteriales bacterium]